MRSKVRLEGVSVHQARDEHLGAAIAEITELSTRSVGQRLRWAHGRSLLRNVFADVWPTSGALPKRPAQSKEPGVELTIRRIRQEYETSCGIAAAAMLAGRTHREVLPVIFPDAAAGRRRRFYTHYPDIIRALDHFGVEHGKQSIRVGSFLEIPTNALVKVKRHLYGQTFWHWVVFRHKTNAPGYVIDPDIQIRGTQRLSERQARRYTPVSYLPVVPILRKRSTTHH